ncbi:MAG: hypothetical protein L6Q33_13735 [Bacteriovoracaceae bacterium]|nr:hypothetical protein [Bacteriovoracaceae bacterium]
MLKELRNEFPKDYFVDVPGQEYLVARITMHKMKTDYMVEMDIILKDSSKIWSHVGSLYKLPDETEALDRSVQYLADYMKSKRL